MFQEAESREALSYPIVSRGQLSDSQSRQALPKVVNHPPTFLHNVHLQQLPDVLEKTSLLVCLLPLFFFLCFYIICTFECDLKSLVKVILIKNKNTH